jgi:hypothetical protein
MASRGRAQTDFAGSYRCANGSSRGHAEIKLRSKCAAFMASLVEGKRRSECSGGVTMNAARSIVSFLSLSASLSAALALASFAHADKSAAEWRDSLTNAAAVSHIPSYERTMPNGTKRVYVNPQGQHLRTIEQTIPAGSDVIEILHMGSPGANHTLAIFDRELLHSQFSQAGHWRLRTWGDKLRPSSTKLFSAMIALKPTEAKNLRERLKAAFAEEGPEASAGPNWENGHLGNALGVRGINCVATWCDIPIGEKGETLTQLVGLNHSYSGNPQGFQHALEREANDRVFGISVYGPPVADFTASQNEDKTLK